MSTSKSYTGNTYDSRYYAGSEQSFHATPTRGISEGNAPSQYSSRYHTSMAPISTSNGHGNNSTHHYGGASTSSSYAYADEHSRDTPRVEHGVVTVPLTSGRRRKLVCAATLEDNEVSTFYVAPPDSSPYRSTVCMDQHVLARMEDDLRRAEVRRTNPDSAIPDRGEQYEQELETCLEARTPVRSARRSVAATPRSGNRANAAFHLPPISPASGRSRTHSRSRSRQTSNCTTPSSQRRAHAAYYTPRHEGLTQRQLQQQQRLVDQPLVADDDTAEFIRREKERDIRRRLKKSQEEDELRRTGRRSPSSRSGAEVNSNARKTTSRKHLPYADIHATDNREDRAVLEVGVNLEQDTGYH